MSFGYGVGDIMAISRLAVKVYAAYKDAPGDYSNISDEVKSLDIIITDAAHLFESTTLSDNKRQRGQEVLRGCQKVLEDLDSLIVKYNSLASPSTSQVFKRIKLGTEDIATLRARLTSNTTLLNGFVQSCEFDKIQSRLDSVLGLQRTMSRDSIVSFAGSINTKKAYKKFCKGLFSIGVTAEMIHQKESEIQDIFKHQNPAASNQIDDSTSADPNPAPHPQLPEVGNSSNAENLPIPSLLTENEPKVRSRTRWVRPPIDFLVGPLMLSAAMAGNTQRLVSILEYVRNINYVDSWGETALHNAAGQGHNDIVQLLLSRGASIEAMNSSNWTPLHYAAYCGHTSTVELLLSKGASVEAISKNNKTPLHLAAENGHTSIVQLLLSRGASIEAMSLINQTPLHCAAKNGHTRIVQLLLSRGASIEAMNSSNLTPLHYAVWFGHTSTVELLLSKGASIEAINNTPLHLAAENGHTSIVQLLLSRGASIDAMNHHNETPLLYAANRGHTSTAELLLAQGASVEAKDKDGDTPLHEAARCGSTSTVELLLSKGASVAPVNRKNETPLDLATLGRHTDAINLLKNELVSPRDIQTVSQK